MFQRNTLQSYGGLTRFFHWATALLILTAIPLGMIATDMTFATADQLALKTTLFSLHKTIGVLAFFVALARIIWAIVQVHPVPLHPTRKMETFAASVVHWMLYISLVVVPLSGWIHHAAVTGFAPIWWPFGQGLPFVPQSETLAALATGVHWLFGKVMIAAIALHILGALKHQFMDRDATLARMLRGAKAPAMPMQLPPAILAPIAAVLITGVTLGVSTRLHLPEATAEAAAPVAVEGGNWQVSGGNLAISVQQMGQEVGGSFGQWQAEITFDDKITSGKAGEVKVTIDTGSVTLGSVSDQAKSADFFDVGQFPQAVFTAPIEVANDGYIAKGSLSLRGVTVPVELPFTLQIEGDRAVMQGSTRLDRRDYKMGESYADESTVGYGVTVKIDLVANRK